MAKQIKSADDVIDRLGGTNAVAEMLGYSATRVSNWRTRGLPPETYLALTAALDSRGFYAPPSLWRMREGTSAA